MKIKDLAWFSPHRLNENDSSVDRVAQIMAQRKREREERDKQRAEYHARINSTTDIDDGDTRKASDVFRDLNRRTEKDDTTSRQSTVSSSSKTATKSQGREKINNNIESDDIDDDGQSVTSSASANVFGGLAKGRTEWKPRDDFDTPEVDDETNDAEDAGDTSSRFKTSFASGKSPFGNKEGKNYFADLGTEQGGKKYSDRPHDDPQVEADRKKRREAAARAAPPAQDYKREGGKRGRTPSGPRESLKQMMLDGTIPIDNRKAFMIKAKELGFSDARANALHHILKTEIKKGNQGDDSKVEESYFIVSKSGEYLAEGATLLRPTFVSLSDYTKNTRVFWSKKEAQNIADALTSTGLPVRVFNA